MVEPNRLAESRDGLGGLAQGDAAATSFLILSTERRVQLLEPVERLQCFGNAAQKALGKCLEKQRIPLLRLSLEDVPGRGEQLIDPLLLE
jgi:hypothetical protein